MPELFLLCEYPTLNGGERSMLATLDGVCAAGLTPVVIAPPEGPLADALAARKIEVLPFSCWTPVGGRVPQNRLREQLAELLGRRQPALLHANSLAMGRLSGPVANELGLPSLSHLRDIVRLSAQALADVNCHTRLLAVSHATRAFHVTAGLDAAKTHVLCNGIDLEQFQPRPATGYLHDELRLPPNCPLIGTIGQIGLRKGQDVLLEAACRLAARLPETHYVIVGERNSEKDESRQFQSQLLETAERELPGRVHFVGVRDDVERLLSELTLLVHPARQEPLGRVLLEAAATGVAVVATDVGGTAEIFPPATESARLIPPDDADALSRAVDELLGDAALRQRMARAARRQAEERFDIRTRISGLVDHYRALTQP
jgi:glycosyltransferase involved in cell wall biosynthesis